MSNLGQEAACMVTYVFFVIVDFSKCAAQRCVQTKHKSIMPNFKYNRIQTGELYKN